MPSQRTKVVTGDDPKPENLEIGALYRAHAQTVARWATRLSGPRCGRDAVEDIVQEVFLTAHRLLPQFRGEAKVTTWLFRITHNVVRHRRRKERVRRFFEFGQPQGVRDDVAKAMQGRTETPSEALERSQARTQVYQLLDGMNDKYRTAFILFELEGLSGEEIATMLGQKVQTIWVWLHRARNAFAGALAKEKENGS